MDGRMGWHGMGWMSMVSSVHHHNPSVADCWLSVVCLSIHRQCAVSTRPPARHTSTGLGAHTLGLCRMTRLTRPICGKR